VTRIRFRRVAQWELRSARDYYQDENPVAAHDFMKEVVRGLRLIREAPRRWPRLDAVRRRFILVKFEYSLVYRFEPEHDTVWILAVAHHRRDPDSWSGR
jgi:plasmid stabilization system protein ParE